MNKRIVFLLCLTLYPWVAVGKPTVKVEDWGRTGDDRNVQLYTLGNGWMSAQVMTLGATLTKVNVPDRNGNLASVTLYLDTLDDYLKGHPLLGSVVGRYANRIAGAQFELDGKVIQIEKNAGSNHIHGGRKGFQKKIWVGRVIEGDDWAGVELALGSGAGEAGFPGNLLVRMRYRLTLSNELFMEYDATTDQPTIVNLTNHAYWNLAGAGSGDVLGQKLMLNAGRYLPFGKGKIPTGELARVDGTPMDFRKGQPIGKAIARVEGGYDHCYVIDGEGLRLAARAEDSSSGRWMEVRTNQPGVQLYTANGLRGKHLEVGGRSYGPHHGFCLEAQAFPNSPNQGNFPSTILRPGKAYRHVTVHKFGVK